MKYHIINGSTKFELNKHVYLTSEAPVCIYLRESLKDQMKNNNIFAAFSWTKIKVTSNKMLKTFSLLYAATYTCRELENDVFLAIPFITFLCF